MTVKELKEALKVVSDDLEVRLVYHGDNIEEFSCIQRVTDIDSKHDKEIRGLYLRF